MTELVEKKLVTLCAHCGDPCEDFSLLGSDNSFCCKGCQTVYELLQHNGLAQFYELEDTPGNSLVSIEEEKFEYLDEVEIQSQLLDFNSGGLAKITFYLPDIHCASCIWLLENLHELDAGIYQSKVNFLKKELYLNFTLSTTKLSKIVALLHRIGYPPKLNLSDLNATEKPIVSKALYYKLGVTGFLFGNIMFMSFPEYLGLDKSVDLFYYQLFAYFNLILGIPLVLYSAWDYLRSASLGLMQGKLNIDVPISIGILSLFGRSAYEILTGIGAGYIDSLAGLIFFLLLGKWFQQKTYHSISFERDYQSYFPIAAQKLKEGKEYSTSLKQLKIGDQLRIRQQELIPADGILLRGAAYIDYSFVTGESSAVQVKKGDLVYAGGKQIGASIDIQLKKAVVQSYLVQLWNDQSFAQKRNHESSSRLANTVSTYFTIVILLIAFTTLIYWLAIDNSIAINAFSAVLIIACPCAVALSIPFTFGNVLRILGRTQFYLKNISVIENLQSITHIVFDKTGTLTKRKGELKFHGKLSEQEVLLVQSLANQSTHPRSQQILDYFQGDSYLNVKGFHETAGFGIEGTIEGRKVSISKSEKGTAIKIDGEEKAYFEHLPILRKGLKDTLGNLQKKYDLSLLSGDQNHHQQYFEKLFGKQEKLHFNHSPKEKLEFIKTLQNKGAVVLMLGDGLNDAGALQQADVGLVLSEDNNNFSPACDGILSSSAFHHFSNYLNYVQKSKWIIYLCYGFALLYNVIGLSYAVRGDLSPVIAAVLMPLSSVTIIVLGVLGTWALRYLYIEDV